MVSKICDLPEGYVPSDSEEFMNDFQREYFRRKLEQWKQDLLQENESGLKSLQEEVDLGTDVADQAITEADVSYELRTKERIRKLLVKIDDALARIQNGTYGFCKETGEPIGLKRLEARPVAMLSIEAQTRHELAEKLRKG